MRKVLETMRYAKKMGTQRLASAACSSVLKNFAQLKESGQFESVTKEELLDLLQQAGKVVNDGPFPLK